jgi:hypothetical protein
MVQWTSPFMIGITMVVSNSDNARRCTPIHYQMLHVVFPQSTFCTYGRIRTHVKIFIYTVLETEALPTELQTYYPYLIIPALVRNLRADFLFLQAFFVAILMALTILSISSFLMRSVQESNLCR